MVLLEAHGGGSEDALIVRDSGTGVPVDVRPTLMRLLTSVYEKLACRRITNQLLANAIS